MEPLTPVQVEEHIRRFSALLDEQTVLVDEAEREMVEAKRDLEVAEARAMLACEGTAAERAAQVTLKVQAERTRYDVAKVVFAAAKRRMETTRDQLTAAQSVGKSVRAGYVAYSGGSGYSRGSY